MPRFTELRFRCSECKRVFYSKKARAAHMRASHSTLGEFACHACHHHFMTMAALRRHCFFCHPGAQPENLCTACDRRFFTTIELENHVNVVHINNQVDFQCETCFYTYQTRDALEHHKRSKHVVQSHDVDVDIQDERTPEAEDTDDDSASIPPLRLKLRCPSTHACEQCDRFFATLKSLKMHQTLKHKKRNGRNLNRLRELPQTEMDQEVVEEAEETTEENETGSVKTIATNIAREAARLIKENSINFTSRLFKNFFLILSNTTAESPDESESQGACSSLHRREPISNSLESIQEPPMVLASPAWNSKWPPADEFENKLKTIFELNQDALGDKNFCNMNFEQINEIFSSFH